MTSSERRRLAQNARGSRPRSGACRSGLVEVGPRLRRMPGRRLGDRQHRVADPAAVSLAELGGVERPRDIALQVQGAREGAVVPDGHADAAVDRVLQVRGALVPAPPRHQPPAELRQALRVVGVERDRAPLHPLGLVVVAAREAQRRQRLPGPHPVRRQRHRAQRRLHAGRHLAGLRGRLDQPVPRGVQVGEGEHRPGVGVARVAPHGLLEAGAHRRVELLGEGQPVGERPLDAVVGGQALGTALAQRPWRRPRG